VDQILTSLASLPATSIARAIQMQAVLGLGDGLQRARSSIGQRMAQGDASTARLIEELLDDAAGLALDTRLPVVARQGAIELVKYGTFARAKPVMVPLLDAKEPREIQLAAARALAGFADADVTSTLLDLWRGYSPALRSEVVELLLARTERISAVFDAVESGIVPSSHISSARRVLLLTHSDSAIKSRAIALLSGDTPSPRKDVIARYQPSLSLAADRLRGKQVFERECVACHRLEGKGFDIGPSLSTIRHRSPAEVLLHILDPNREVAPNFMQYVVATDDGRISTGIIAQESVTSITLRRGENVTEDILRDNIRELSTTEKSLMPEGLEAKVSVQEMADLLQYLLGT
jgi:putative heme-binding domain-containing protein